MWSTWGLTEKLMPRALPRLSLRRTVLIVPGYGPGGKVYVVAELVDELSWKK